MHTLDEVREVARKVATENPDKLNPRAPRMNTCAYTSPTDPDWHCFGGQICINLGLPVPGQGDEGLRISQLCMDGIYEGQFEDAAIEVLVWCQQFADGLTINHPVLGRTVSQADLDDPNITRRRPWGMIVPYLEQF